jgi:hypothetical protein
MAVRPLSAFSPFSLQVGANATLHAQAQEVVWYAESRFRRALIDTSKAEADPRRQTWLQKCLRAELVRGIMLYFTSELQLPSSMSSLQSLGGPQQRAKLWTSRS